MFKLRKITNFLVEKRYFILTLVLLMAVGCAFLTTKVHINRDISKYLPKTSEVRQGMDTMNKYFDTKNSSLNVMFKDLSKSKQAKIKEELEALDGVSEVSQKNKKSYTLYEITTSLDKDSKKAAKLYDDIYTKYADYDIVTSGDIDAENKAILPVWLVPLAISCALVILIIMSQSYIEPFLFLASILIAVLLNKGTNIIFPSISSITDSIAAILQLALSMDYSIMLINRYRQEKETEKDNVKAMKKALYHAFKSISSSSVTTIVGLLALVFMSFTIGFDLGMVLAKGVLFSLFTIFTVLPSLILMFDKLIIKTKKKSFNLKLDFLGKVIYKIRYVGIFLIVGIFIASFLLKGNLNIAYTDTETDEVSKVFTPNNQMAIIYPTKAEEQMIKVCEKLKNDYHINELLCYSNTINEPLKYQDVNAKLNDLGNDTVIEDDLLKIAYYNYYNNTDIKMTLNNFVSFIQNDIYPNANMSKHLDTNTRHNIERLKNFINIDSLNKPRSLEELANMFEIDNKEVEDLLIYYNSLNENTTLSLKEFTDFMNNYVQNSEYKDNVDQNSQNELKQIAPFLNQNTLKQNLDYEQMANLFGLDKKMTQDLYLYYLLFQDIDATMTLEEFAQTLKESDYFTSLDTTTQEQLEMISKFSNEDFINKENTVAETSLILGIPEELTTQIYTLKYTIEEREDDPLEYKVSLKDFINFTLTNEQVSANLPEEMKESLNNLVFIMNNKENYTYQEIATTLNIPEDSVKSIYILKTSQGFKMTPINFIDFILEHQNDNVLSSKLNKEAVQNLSKIQNITQSVLNNQTYNYNNMAQFLNANPEDLKLLYSLYDLKYKGNTVNLSYENFVNFLLNDVLTNSQYSSNIDTSKKEKIETVNKIIASSLNETKYSSDELYNLLNNLSDDVQKNLVEMLYIYYGSENNFNNDWTLSLEQFVNYLNDDVLTDYKFTEFIDDTWQNDIKKAKEDIKTAKELLVTPKYSRAVLNTNYQVENKQTMNFIKDIKNDLSEDSYIIGNSPMALDMSESFEKELNLITILTIIFIFIVVCITFKSFIIPVVLVLLIQTAVYTTMGILSFEGGTVYFIALLIVQSILMGATIDYAILYTSYYQESRKTLGVKDAIINAYNKSIHTILTSASILIIVTLIVGHFSTAITSKICMTISQGTICSSLLILFILPMLIASFDRFFIKKNRQK